MFKRKITGYLETWAKSLNRKPLVVRGARQVGKTSIIKAFGEKNFANFIYLNLDNVADFDAFAGRYSLQEFETRLKIAKQKNLDRDNTLLFIDEIQGNPHLISLLRYLYEEKPQTYVIAAGSLLEIEMKKAALSMPVGRVEYAYMYPLDFFEYLLAKEEFGLLEHLTTLPLYKPVSEVIHLQALALFREYILVGGMPEAVDVFIKSADPQLLPGVYANLLQSFIDDIYKYAKSSEVKYLLDVVKNAPFYSCTKITYENFAQLGYKSREVSRAFSILEEVMLVNLIGSTNSFELPLVTKPKRSKKLIFLDSGFYNYVYKIPFNINIEDLSSTYRGNILEQVVAQNIIAQNIADKERLFYWAVDKKKGSAEVDFCFSKGQDIIGIEVKSGSKARSRSLSVFKDKVGNARIIKLYPGNIVQSKKTRLISIPIYLVPRVYEL